MNTRAPRSALASIASSAIAALQPRLMLLWVLITLVPTFVVALPLWKTLDGLLSHSVHAPAWARGFDGLMFSDVMDALRDSQWIGASVAVGILLSLLASPFLAGMAVASGKAGRSLGFGALLQGGATEYGRLLRLAIIALVPYALFVCVALGLSSFVGDRVDAVTLETKANWYQFAGMALTGLFFAIAQAIVESARAQFIADVGLRSAFRAMGRGIVMFLRRPLTCLLTWVTITVAGGAGSVAIAVWRGHTTAAGVGVVSAFLIVQLGVAIVAWTRTARLLALAGLVATHPAQRRRRTDFAPAL